MTHLMERGGGNLLSLFFLFSFSLRFTIPSILTALHLCMGCVLGRECAPLLKDIYVHGRGRNWVGSGVGIEAGKESEVSHWYCALEFLKQSFNSLELTK